LTNLKYSYDIDIDIFNKKQNKHYVNEPNRYKLTDRFIVSGNKDFKSQKNANTNQLKTRKEKLKSVFFKKLNIYYGILFILVFCFLFFLSVSLSYASPKKYYTDENEFIYSNSNSLSLIKESINLDEKKNEKETTDRNEITGKIEYSKYKVKNKDTISTVAKKFGLSEDTIILTNYVRKSRFMNGITLIIPNQNGRLITVNNNDSVFKIANRYGVAWEKIADVNDLKSENIVSGTKIFIPESRMTDSEKEKYYDNNNKSYIWPLKGIITSPFGLRLDPFTLTYDYHTGLDIGGNSYGTPVKSINDGNVLVTGFDDIYGNYIVIRHNNGIVSKYCHLSKINVKTGSKVTLGQIIGNIGSSGRSTGAHLHFEILKNGKLMNPQKIYN
jgi:murein DD-endopeptidase MepM/ murein hydrolase activator NlpD